MTNEEFQRIVLEELRGLKGEVGGLKGEVGGLKGEISGLKEKVGSLEAGQKQLTERVGIMDRKIDAIYEQTADLTEFKEETSKNCIKIQHDNKRLKEIVGRHEIDMEILQEKIG